MTKTFRQPRLLFRNFRPRGPAVLVRAAQVTRRVKVSEQEPSTS